MNCDDDGFEKTLNGIDTPDDMTAVTAILAENLASLFLANHHDDCCTDCGIPVDEADPDDRTPEQLAADVAAATLARLAAVGEEIHTLEEQLNRLSGYMLEHGDNSNDKLRKATRWLVDFEGVLRTHRFFIQAVITGYVRDIAATLPIRGIDYGTETE
jgi:hypothetical protein